MLNYRNTLILFMIMLSGMIFADIYRPVSIWWYIGIVLVLTVILVLGSVYIRLGFYLQSRCLGNRDVNAVAFSFDDGPDRMVTPFLLDILKKEGIQAVFFVTGRRVQDNFDLIRRMEKEGHIIGGHSFSHHFFFDFFPAGRMRKELKLSADLVEQAIGKKMKLFRPPYGVTNPTVGKVIRNLGYHSIGWSLKSRDTVAGNENTLLRRLKNKVKPGDLILFHDTKPIILVALPEFIAYLREKQVQIVRPDQLLNIEAYE